MQYSVRVDEKRWTAHVETPEHFKGSRALVKDTKKQDIAKRRQFRISRTLEQRRGQLHSRRDGNAHERPAPRRERDFVQKTSSLQKTTRGPGCRRRSCALRPCRDLTVLEPLVRAINTHTCTCRAQKQDEWKQTSKSRRLADKQQEKCKMTD